MVESSDMNATPRSVRAFQEMIYLWWECNRRDLPWRRTRDPYRILVSEVMLQQTQVSRVLPKYEEFLYFFPDVYALAGATSAQVLRVWKGMGYNRRALYLKRAAESVVRIHHGEFPDDESSLMNLPGLGLYTARAIMVFAFEKDVAMVDTNIRQIIVRFFFKGVPQKEKLILETASMLVPKGKSWTWHQALMDYGALALPRSDAKTTPAKKVAVPFADTDRFIRGRILDMLRDDTRPEKQLISDIVKKYGRKKMQCRAIISGLIKDGLIVRTGNTLSLPE